MKFATSLLFRSLIVALILLTASRPVFAGCSTPTGIAGDIIYNGTYNVLQYCNGTNWINAGSLAANTGAMTSGDFCTASGNQVICSTGSTGTGSVVLSTSPTITGTLAAAAGTFSGTVAGVTSTWTGQVAIGTTTPNGALNVNGTLYATAFNGSGASLTGIGTSALSGITGTPSSNTYLRGDGTWANVSAGTTTGSGTTNYLALWVGTAALGNANIYQSGSNIGIGTASPSTLLQVVGTVTATGFSGSGASLTGIGTSSLTAITGTPSGTTFLAGNGTWTTALTALPALTSANIWVGNGSNVATGVALSGDCTLSNAGAITCTKTNSVAFGSLATANTVNLATQVSGGLGIANGGTNSTGQTTNGVIYYNGTNIASGTGFVYTGTNVGIGTTSPNNTLEVVGTIQTSSPNHGLVLMTLGDQITNAANKGWVVRANADSSPTNGNADSLGFEYWNAASETLGPVFAASGYLGIGTASPGTALQVFNDTWPQVSINDASGGAAGIRIASPNVSGSQPIIQFVNNAGSTGWFIGQNPSGGTSDYNSFVVRETGQGDRLTINPGGNVGIGTASPTGPLHIYNTSGNGTLRLEQSSSTPWTMQWLNDAYSKNWANSAKFWQDGSGNLDIIAATGGVYLASGATSWSSLSDMRMKKNIKTLPVLDRLNAFRAVTFDWKATGKHDVGVIAQEVYRVFPEVVHKGSDDPNANVDDIRTPGLWSVDYDKLGVLALQAAQELKIDNDNLRSLHDADAKAIEELRREVVELKRQIHAK